MTAEIFISYRRADKDWARALRDHLRAQGVEAWYDTEIGAGEDWRDATTSALQAAKVLVLLYSSGAADSTEIAKELAMAAHEKKPIVPVRLENVAPSGAFLYELARLNWVDAFENTDDKLAELAKTLAASLKSGRTPLPPSIDQTVAAPARPRPGRRWIYMTGGAVAAAAAATIIVFALKPAPGPVDRPPAHERIAVFTPVSPAGDAALGELASGLASEIVDAMNAMGVESVARSLTTNIAANDRFTKARELGAAYILDGDVRREGDRVLAAVRLDDIASHATLWSRSFSGSAAKPAQVRAQAAAQATSLVSCLSGFLKSIKLPDSETQRLLVRICSGAWNLAEPTEKLDLARKLVARLPDSSAGQAIVAFWAANSVAGASASARGALISEADAAARRALSINAREGFAYLGLFSLAINKGAPLAEREGYLVRGLDAEPNLALLNNHYGFFLRGVGRNVESISYARSALSHDPFSSYQARNLAAHLAGIGQVAETQALLAKTMERWPSIDVWRSLMRLSLLTGAGDMQALLAEAPDEVKSAPEVKCWQDLQVLFGGKRVDAKGEAPSIVQACQTVGVLTPNNAIQILGNVGSLDAAFAIADRAFPDGPSAAQTSVFFVIEVRPMQRDARFMPLMKRLGLIDYWRQSGHWPDFCREPGLPYDCKAEAARLAQ